MPCRRTALASVPALLLACALARAADEVALKGGERFSGEVLELKDGALALKTAYGTISIPQGEIASLKMEKPLLVALPGAEPVSVAIQTDAKGEFEIAAGKKAKLADVASVLPPPPPPVPPTEIGRWSGDLGASVFWTDGNTHTLIYRGALNLVRDQSGEGEDVRNKFAIGLRYSFGKTGGAQILRQGFGFAKWDLFFHPRLGAYVEGTWLYDYEAGLDRKNTLGAGLSAKVVDEETLKVNFDLGVSYVGIFYNDHVLRAAVAAGGDPDEFQEYPGLRAMLEIKWTMPWEFEFYHRSVAVTSLDDTSIYTYDGEASIARKISGAWFAKLAVMYHHLEPPAPGRRRGDVEYMLSLTIKF